MASTTSASRALLFMRHCRRPSPVQRTHRHSSTDASPSPYAPSNYTRPTPSSRSNTSSTTADQSSPFPSTLPGPAPPWAHPKSRPPATEIPGTRFTFTSWLLSLVGIAPKPISTYTPAPFRVTNNPYRARKRWPPDFRNLDPKQQFHFEKVYRKRAALKWARPRWNKGVKILQQSLITMTVIYFVFICEPGNGMGTPFDGFRIWFFDKLGTLGQLPESTREEAGKLSEQARQKMKRPVDTTVSPTAS